ncbi:MYND-type domain-containing protein [Favolaschia claudopus]|uniref:MYND-type domain-containing protein n=1 Tax=Favolaschia claudopus TaxID=2862362 RepID=A0AAV9ZKX1_9AGAR
MHPALHIDNIKRLPASKRSLCNAAVSGTRTLENLKLVRTTVLTSTPAERLLILPVLYFNLNPTEIPDFDVFDSESQSQATLLAAHYSIGRAVYSIEALYTLELPEGIGVDLWPRVWPWLRFLYFHQHRNPNHDSMAEQSFFLDFLLFVGKLADETASSDLIVSTPWFWFMLGRTWHHVPAVSDLQKRMLAFNELRHFLLDKKLTDPANMEELVDGAGGTLYDIAYLVVIYINAVILDEDSVMDVNHIQFLQSVLTFVGIIDPTLDDPRDAPATLGRFGEALLSNDILAALTHALLSLIKTSTPSTASALRACFNLLTTFFISTSGSARLAETVKGGFFAALIHCARSRFARDLQMHLKLYLDGILSAAAIDHRLLSAIESLWCNIDTLTDSPAFKPSGVIHESWMAFRSLIDERLGVFREFKETASSMRACDNLDCFTMDAKEEFRRCSGCQSFYYCSSECQVVDWRNGGHREACNSYGTLLLGEKNKDDFNARQRSFLRSLVHHHYQQHRFVLHFKQTLFMATYPGQAFVTIYDYSEGAVNVDIKSARRMEILFGSEWDDIVARAATSRGRIGVDVVIIGAPTGSRCLVVPLRSSASVVRERITELAGTLPAPRQWDPKIISGKVEAILLGEGANVVENH